MVNLFYGIEPFCLFMVAKDNVGATRDWSKLWTGVCKCVTPKWQGVISLSVSLSAHAVAKTGIMGLLSCDIFIVIQLVLSLLDFAEIFDTTSVI